MAQAERAAATDRRCRCGGDMRLVEQDEVSRWGDEGVYVRVTGVPMWVCDRCGSEVLEGDVAQRVSELVRAGATGADRIDQLPVKAFGRSPRGGEDDGQGVR